MVFNIISNREWEYDQVTVTIKGATTTSTYDAANHSASGYTVTISDPNYKTTDFSFIGTSSATGKNAGTYYMGMTSAQFVNNNPRFRNVVFSVTDGYVKINRKAVTVKADNLSKTYGQSDPTLTAKVSGTLGSDTVTYSLSRASGNNVGSYTITPTGNATQGNYTVGYQNGTLTINKAAAAALGLSVSGGTYTYNGTGRSISASVSVTTGTTIQYSTDNTNWSNTNPSYKNAGTYKVYARAVNSNYNTATGNANVVINPASCTLTANSGTKTYNGSSQSVTGFTSSPSGLSFSGVSASGSRKDVGSSDVTFSGVTINTTKDTTGNYKVTGTTKGTLTINKAAASALGLKVTSYSGYYDGSPHKLTATVTVTSGTTIQYSTDNTNWSNTNPQYTNEGTYTVYVRAVNSNYNTATASGTVTIEIVETVPTTGLVVFNGISSRDINLQYGLDMNYTYLSPRSTSWAVNKDSEALYTWRIFLFNDSASSHNAYGLLGSTKRLHFPKEMSLHATLASGYPNATGVIGYSSSKSVKDGAEAFIGYSSFGNTINVPAGDWYIYVQLNMGAAFYVGEISIS